MGVWRVKTVNTQTNKAINGYKNERSNYLINILNSDHKITGFKQSQFRVSDPERESVKNS